MAYDEALADRVRDVLAPRAEVTEREMFGGIAFMVGGNMAVGVLGEELMVRLDPADADLVAWVEAGADHAASLPPQVAASARTFRQVPPLQGEKQPLLAP